MPTQKSKTRNSQRSKQSSTRSNGSSRTKKAAASKTSKSTTKSKKAKKKSTERPAWLKKRDELTLKMFQMTYEDYQQGKFHRIL